MLLLTGATGLLGHAVVRRLTASGIPVRCLVRDPRRLGPERVRVQLAIGDLADPASWRNALRGVDTVVHLAGGARDQPRATVEELNGLAAWRLLRAAERVGRAISSGSRRSAPRRTTRCACSAPRRWPRRRSRRRRIPTTTLAHSLDLRARRSPPALARAARLPARRAAGRARDRPHAAALGRGRRRLPDRGARRAARRDHARYELAGPETLTQREFVRLVLAASGRRRRTRAAAAGRPARRAAGRGDAGRAGRPWSRGTTPRCWPWRCSPRAGRRTPRR